MTAVIQTVPANGLAGVANKTLTLTATGAGNSIVVTIAVEAGSTTYTAFTIADSQSNTYSNAAILAAGGRSAAVYYCLAPTAGVTSVTVTGTGGSGGMFGALAAQEVSGLTALDKHNTGSAPAASPMTLTNSGADATAVDFVTAAISIGNGAANCGISDPPTGYTTSAISQNDSTDGAGACCYRINSSAVTDSVIWAATSWLPTAPAAIASFSGTAGTTVIPVRGAALAPLTGSRALGPLGLGGFALKRSVTLLPSAQGSGTSALQIGQSGTLTGAGTLAGSSALQIGQTGALTGSGVLAGTSALTFAQTGILTGSGVLTGTSALVFGQSGTLTQPGLNGSAALVFGQSGTLIASGVLAGSSALQFAQTAALTGAGTLSGASALAFGQAGNLLAAGTLAGVSALSFAQTASLLGAGSLTGSSALTFGASGTADLPAGSMTGTAGLSLAASATASGFGALIGNCQIILGASGSIPSSVLAGEGMYRRKKKRKPLPVIQSEPVFIAPASIEHELPRAVIERVPEFTNTVSLAEVSIRADRQIEALVDESDDEEALEWILKVLD